MKQSLVDYVQIENLEFSARTQINLKKADITTLKQLIQYNEDDLLKALFMDMKSLDELKDFLYAHDLKLSGLKHNTIAVKDVLVGDLGFSVHTLNRFKNMGVLTLKQLMQYKSEAELIRVPTFGRKSLNEVKSFLKIHDLHIGMEIDKFSEFIFKIDGKGDIILYDSGKYPTIESCLTEREQLVLSHRVSGKTLREISDIVGVKGIQKILEDIYRTLGHSNKIHLKEEIKKRGIADKVYGKNQER